MPRTTLEDYLSLLPLEDPTGERSRRPGESSVEASYRVRAEHIRSMEDLSEDSRRRLLDLLVQEWRNDPATRGQGEPATSHPAVSGPLTPKGG